MINYEVKVTSQGAFIWGSDSFNTTVIDRGQSDLVVRNSEYGEIVEGCGAVVVEVAGAYQQVPHRFVVRV